MTSSVGPVSFTADYVVKSVEGKNVTIEVGLPEPKVTLDVQVEKDFIRIRTKHVFAGDWKKTGARYWSGCWEIRLLGARRRHREKPVGPGGNQDSDDKTQNSCSVWPIDPTTEEGYWPDRVRLLSG
jgi:hypothetical protein